MSWYNVGLEDEINSFIVVNVACVYVNPFLILTRYDYLSRLSVLYTYSIFISYYLKLTKYLMNIENKIYYICSVWKKVPETIVLFA
jgi:hypothetical protein